MDFYSKNPYQKGSSKFKGNIYWPSSRKRTRGGSRISEEGVQTMKRGVRLPNFTQNLLKFPMKMK